MMLFTMNTLEDILDSRILARLIFYPEKTPIPRDLPAYVKILHFLMKDGTKIGGLFFLKDPKMPTMLVFHGNGEIAENYAYFHHQFFDCGVNLAVMDYRGYGFSEGEPTYRSIIDDAMPIYNNLVNWLKLNSYSDRVFIFGRSLGSVCAAEIGSHNPAEVCGIVFESAFGDTILILRRLFQIDVNDAVAEQLKAWSNDTKMARIKKPVLILHGTDDFIIPYQQAPYIYKTLKVTTQKELITIEGAGHNDISLFTERYYPPLKKFIQNSIMI